MLAALAVGCGESRALPPQCEGAHCAVQRTIGETYEHGVDVRLDILLVVDDTPSAEVFASSLPAAYDNLVASLKTLPGGLPDLRLAVVPASRPGTTSGCAGAPPRASLCGLDPSNPVASNGPCGADANYGTSLEDSLSCLGALGTASCGSFEPLSAVRRALGGEPGVAALPGFQSADRALAVIIVAGRDDASEQPIGELVAFLRGLKTDGDDVTVWVAGPVAGCGAGGVPRLTAFAETFGRGGYKSACADAFQFNPRALVPLDSGFPVCLDGVKDTDLSTPGLQVDCTFEAARASLDAPAVFPVAALRSCDLAPAPCWRLVRGASDSICPTGWARFDIDRGPGGCPQRRTRMRISCLGCAQADDPGCL